MAESQTFVVVDDGAATWGLLADRVAQVVSEAEWTGAPPLSLSSLALLPAPASTPSRTEETSRVLVTRTDGAADEASVAILGRGLIGILVVGESEVLVLPSFMRRANDGSFVSHVIFREGTTPLFVVDIDALAQRASSIEV